MEAAIRNLRILLRADGIIAEIRLHQLLTRSGFTLFAALVACFGLFMLNLAGYFAAVPMLGQSGAAGAMAAADLLLALLLFLIGARLKPGRDLALAQELHNSALEALLGESRRLEGLLRNPLPALLPGLIGPLVTLVVQSLKRGQKPAPDA